MNAGDTSWVLVSTALVLFMTPGWRCSTAAWSAAKNVLGDAHAELLRHGAPRRPVGGRSSSSLAFGDAGNGGFIGNLDFAFLNDVGQGHDGRRLPELPHDPVHPLLRVPDDVRDHHARAHHRRDGRPAEVRRLRRRSSRSGWSLVYGPVAHWVFAGGWLAEMGALDFAGGAVVHINAGAAALALVLLLGVRKGYPAHADAAAQPADDDDRHRHPVVRLGRLQRRLGARGQRRRRGRRS